MLPESLLNMSFMRVAITRRDTITIGIIPRDTIIIGITPRDTIIMGITPRDITITGTITIGIIPRDTIIMGITPRDTIIMGITITLTLTTQPVGIHLHLIRHITTERTKREEGTVVTRIIGRKRRRTTTTKTGIVLKKTKTGMVLLLGMPGMMMKEINMRREEGSKNPSQAQAEESRTITTNISHLKRRAARERAARRGRRQRKESQSSAGGKAPSGSVQRIAPHCARSSCSSTQMVMVCWIEASCSTPCQASASTVALTLLVSSPSSAMIKRLHLHAVAECLSPACMCQVLLLHVLATVCNHSSR